MQQDFIYFLIGVGSVSLAIFAGIIFCKWEDRRATSFYKKRNKKNKNTMKSDELLFELRKFIAFNPENRADLNDILSDDDLSEESKIDEIVSFLEKSQVRKGFKAPSDQDIFAFARYVLLNY